MMLAVGSCFLVTFSFVLLIASKRDEKRAQRGLEMVTTMSDAVIVSLVNAGGAVVVLLGVKALLLTFRLFRSLARHIRRIEQELDLIVVEHDKRISRLEHRQ